MLISAVVGMVEEAGVTPLLHCTAVGVIKEGDRIVAVITESKSGRQAILAKTIIDATGDADIAHHAGAPYRKGDENGELMPVTMNFGMSGVDVEKFKQYQRDNPVRTSDWATQGENQDVLDTALAEPFEKAKAAGEIPREIRMGGAMHTLTEAGEAIASLCSPVGLYAVTGSAFPFIAMGRDARNDNRI